MPTKFQVTLVVKQNKNIEVPALEVKAAARRNGAVVRTYIDRACTHVICSMSCYVLYFIMNVSKCQERTYSLYLYKSYTTFKFLEYE